MHAHMRGTGGGLTGHILARIAGTFSTFISLNVRTVNYGYASGVAAGMGRCLCSLVILNITNKDSKH